MSKILYVEWDDSSSSEDGGWQHASRWKGFGLLRCHSIGLVIEETKHGIVLAPHWYDPQDGSGDLTVSGCMRIPRSAIRKTRVIRP